MLKVYYAVRLLVLFAVELVLANIAVARTVLMACVGSRRRYCLPWFARLAALLYRVTPGFGEWLMRRQLAEMRRREASASAA